MLAPHTTAVRLKGTAPCGNVIATKVDQALNTPIADFRVQWFEAWTGNQALVMSPASLDPPIALKRYIT